MSSRRCVAACTRRFFKRAEDDMMMLAAPSFPVADVQCRVMVNRRSRFQLPCDRWRRTTRTTGGCASRSPSASAVSRRTPPIKPRSQRWVRGFPRRRLVVPRMNDLPPCARATCSMTQKGHPRGVSVYSCAARPATRRQRASRLSFVASPPVAVVASASTPPLTRAAWRAPGCVVFSQRRHPSSSPSFPSTSTP